MFNADVIFKASDAAVPNFEIDFDTMMLTIKPKTAIIGFLYRVYGYCG